MNVRIKRLLSMLVVMAMIATMIVPMNFSTAKAEETPASQTEIAKGNTVKEKSEEVKAAFEGATGEVTAVCPVCAANGDTAEKTWTGVSATSHAIADSKTVIAAAGGHYYIAEDIAIDYFYVSGFFEGYGCINLNGKSVTLNGAKFARITGGAMNIMDTAGGAVVTGSVDQYGNDGKTLRVYDDTGILNLFGGTFQAMNDTYTKASTDNANGSATVAIRGGTLNMYDGATIIGVDGTTGNTSKWGGAVFLNTSNNPVFNMYGGTVKNGTATGGGGNICLYGGKATANIYAGEILGGTGTGGNIYINSVSSSSFGTLNMYGGFVGGGAASAQKFGRNIYLNGAAAGSYAVLNMSGGTVVGEVYANEVLTANHTVTMSGSAKIVNQAYHNGKLYTGTCGIVKCSFATANLGEGSYIMLGTALTDTWGWCDACKAAKKWTAITDSPTATSGEHYRVKNDITKTYTTVAGGSTFLNGTQSFCVDLSGYDVTVNGGRFLTVATASKTVNVFDKVGDSVVKASNDIWDNNGMVIQTAAENATINLYGGTYKAFDSAATSNYNVRTAAPIRLRAGIMNVYEGAVIDGTGIVDSTGAEIQLSVATVFIGNTTAATFNLEGGTVIGGTPTASATSGAFRVGNAEGDGTLNIKSGTIIGSSNTAPAINVRTGCTLNISGGTIKNADEITSDVITTYNANTNGAKLNISGGAVEGRVAASPNTSVALSGKPVVARLYMNGFAADVTGLTAEADITFEAALGTVLTTATTEDLSAALKVANASLTIKKNTDNQYYVAEGAKQPDKDDFNPEACDGLAWCPSCEDYMTWTAIDSNTEIVDKATVITMDAEHDHYYFAEDIIVNYSNVVSGFIDGTGCLNLNGKTVTLNGGKLVDLTAGNTMNIMDIVAKGETADAVVTGSCDQYGNDGKAIRVKEAGAELNLYGGTYKAMNDTYSAYGSDTDAAAGSATVAVRGGTLNLYDGATIIGVDGTAGNSSTSGGSLWINSVNSATANIYGGAILNGHATNGGNIYLNPNGVLNIEGGFIGGGTASSGPNIHINTYSGNSNVTFNVKGGTIVGGIRAGLAGTVMTVSGAPKIVPSAAYEGVTYTASMGTNNISFAASVDQLTKGADIWYNTGMSESYTWCDCSDKIVKWSTIVENTEVTKGSVVTAGGHYRMLNDFTQTLSGVSGANTYFGFTANACVDLNGCDLTVAGGRFLTVATADTTVNVFDKVGGAVVKASNDYWAANGMVLQTAAENATINLYGGTYKAFDSAYTPNYNVRTAAPVQLRAGIMNVYEGAVIDGTGIVDSTGAEIQLDVATVVIGNTTAATFNLEGGTVIGGTPTASATSGAFRVGNAEGDGTLNIKSGTIIGSSNALPAINVRTGCTLNISGGTIKNADGITSDVITTYNANTNGAKLNISGGKIDGQMSVSANSSLTLSGAPEINGLMVNSVLMDVSGLTAEAKIALTGMAEGAVTAAFDGIQALVDADVFTVTNAYYVEIENNQIVLKVSVAEIDGKGYGSIEAALADYDIATGAKISFNGEAVIAEDIILDVANSKNLSLSGSGTVYGIDTTNDDFVGYIKITVTGDVAVAPETVDAATGYRYMALKEGESTYGFHRFETKLTHVTLRTTAAGLYYKAEYKCDTLVRDRVKAYGVVLSVQDMPDANFLADNGNLYTVIEGQFATEYGAEVANTVKTTSGSVFGILKEDRDAALNTQYLTVDVYANSYILVDTDGNGETAFFMADTTNGGKKRTDEGFDGVAKNLLEVVEAINDSKVFDSLTDTQKENMYNFVMHWANYLDDAGKALCMSATDNILAYKGGQ